MGDTGDFTEKAREAEALAASAQYPMFRVFFGRIAQEYWALAQQESGPVTESH